MALSLAKLWNVNFTINKNRSLMAILNSRVKKSTLVLHLIEESSYGYEYFEFNANFSL